MDKKNRMRTAAGEHLRRVKFLMTVPLLCSSAFATDASQHSNTPPSGQLAQLIANLKANPDAINTGGSFIPSRGIYKCEEFDEGGAWLVSRCTAESDDGAKAEVLSEITIRMPLKSGYPWLYIPLQNFNKGALHLALGTDWQPVKFEIVGAHVGVRQDCEESYQWSSKKNNYHLLIQARSGSSSDCSVAELLIINVIKN